MIRWWVARVKGDVEDPDAGRRLGRDLVRREDHHAVVLHALGLHRVDHVDAARRPGRTVRSRPTRPPGRRRLPRRGDRVITPTVPTTASVSSATADVTAASSPSAAATRCSGAAPVRRTASGRSRVRHRTADHVGARTRRSRGVPVVRTEVEPADLLAPQRLVRARLASARSGQGASGRRRRRWSNCACCRSPAEHPPLRSACASWRLVDQHVARSRRSWPAAPGAPAR